jgi:aerobic-type carbon monoxide dehydrogenase small subunit (CoxS/CutS family)
VPIAQVEGAEVLTIEGLGGNHPLQRAFMHEVGAQCGICTPGMIMAAIPLGAERKAPALAKVREALAGNLCRCTGYEAIYRAIESAHAPRTGSVAPSAQGAPGAPAATDEPV